MLVLGYLSNQRSIRDIGELESIQVDWQVGAAAVVTKSGIDQIEQRTAKRVVTTGCGQGTIFGALMDSLDEIHLPGYARVKQSAITQLVDTIRTHSSIYKKAGSVHACALFNADATLM